MHPVNKYNHEQYVKRLETEIEQLEAAQEEVKQESKKMRGAGWYDSGEFKMLKSEMSQIIINIDMIVEKALGDK